MFFCRDWTEGIAFVRFGFKAGFLDLGRDIFLQSVITFLLYSGDKGQRYRFRYFSILDLVLRLEHLLHLSHYNTTKLNQNTKLNGAEPVIGDNIWKQ